MMVMKLVLGMALFFGLGSFVAEAAGFADVSVQVGGAVALLSLIPVDTVGVFASTPTVSSLAAYGGKYEKKVFSTLRNELDLLKDTTVIPGIKNSLNLTKLTVASGTRAYREQFDAADGDLDYTPRKLSVELLKRDIQINPLKYRETWMSELMKPGVNPQDLPFAQYVFDEIAKKVAQEVNDGSYLAVKGAGNSVATTVDGFGTIIAGLLTGQTPAKTAIATGAITASNAVSKFEQMMKSMPVVYRNAGFDIFCSYANWDNYQEDYRDKYGKYLETNKDGFFYIDSTKRKVKIVPATWMNSSGRLIATPKENIVTGVDAIGDMDKIHTDVELELLKLRILFAIGFQIRDLDALQVNDQA